LIGILLTCAYSIKISYNLLLIIHKIFKKKKKIRLSFEKVKIEKCFCEGYI
jgi:hypothetical protein